MTSVIDRVSTALIEAEANRPETYCELPNSLRELADVLKSHGKQTRSNEVRQRAISLESLSRDPDAVRIILELLAREIEVLQAEAPDIFSPEETAAPTPSESSSSTDEEDAMESGAASDTDDNSDLIAVFLTEAQEHLSSAESMLMTLEKQPEDREALNGAFRVFHSIKGSSRFVGLDDLADLAQVGEDVLDAARSDVRVLTGTAIQLLMDCVDALRRNIGLLSQGMAPSELHSDTSLITLAVRLEGVLDARLLANAATPPKRAETAAAPVSVAQPAATPTATAPTAAVPANDTATPVAEERTKAVPATNAVGTEGPSQPKSTVAVAPPAEAVRVDRGKLDALIDLVGELVICESMVNESCGGGVGDHRTENRNLHQLHKITRELQELSLALRMVPITGLFQKNMRLVRDLSKKLNKPVEVVLSGEDTELDKTVIDQISDPLMHIIRNSLDHGIEPDAATRVACGKPEKATVNLRAYHQSGDICIEIRDDGRGLNRKRILAKAIERGLVEPGQHLSDDEICNLIFRPGFSTAEKVTDVSGRGVGMDVVRQNIMALRGMVNVESTEHVGTCITLRLPLTLGIIDGMIVRSGSQRFIVPTSVIVELIQPHPENISHVQHRGLLLNVRGQSVPFFRLDQAFGIASQCSLKDGIVVLVEDRNRLAGLYVDQVVGRQQVVIKGLQGIEGDLDCYAGCAVMPDGLVGLILDIPATLELARRVQQPEPTNAERSDSCVSCH